MRGMKDCPACGESIGNASKRCRYCGHGEASTQPSGYRRVYVPGHPMANSDGYALEHRWMLHEMALPVPPGSHVHHKNGMKDDNRWSNLEVLTASEHLSGHAQATGAVVNQFGIWPVARTYDERLNRQRQTQRERRAQKRAVA